MANTLVLKRSSVAAKVPLAADLVAGELAVNLADAKLYTKDGSGNVILVGSGAGGSASITVSDTAPVSPADGAMWWNSTAGQLKIYYNDGTSSQWVDAFNGQGSRGEPGAGFPVGGTAGQVLKKNSSSDYDTIWGSTDPLDLSHSSPSAPAANTVRIFGRKIANRMLPAFIGPSGLDSSLQPSMARNNITMVRGISGVNAPGVFGTTVTATGTGTAANIATTNVYTWLNKTEYLVTTASTSAVAGWRGNATRFGRGNIAGMGGFFFVCRFGVATGTSNANKRLFVGLRNSTAAPTDVNPSTLTDVIGIGYDAADSALAIIHNDNTGTATKIDLGTTNFAEPSTDRTGVFEIALFCAPNGTTVFYEATNLVTGAVATGSLITDLPSTTTLLNFYGYSSVGGTSAVTGIALISAYVETDY